MTDPHDRFHAWLVDGAPGEPPRDAALHASACEVCLADVAALDSLLALDAGAAATPDGVPVAADGQPPMLRALRALSGVTAVALLVTAAMIGAGALRDRTSDLQVGAGPTATPAGEGILAGGGGASGAADPTSSGALPTDEPSSTDSAEATPTFPPFIAPPPPVPTPAPGTPTLGATQPPPPLQPTPAPPTAAPPTAAPPIAAPPTPTPEPTPLPSEEPVPTPSEEPPTPEPDPTGT